MSSSVHSLADTAHVTPSGHTVVKGGHTRGVMLVVLLV